MPDRRILRILALIRKQVAQAALPSVTRVSRSKGPFLVLVSCILSLRTKDKTTNEAAERLFRMADTPRKMRRLSLRSIRKLIYPVGFYRTKAKVIVDISKELLSRFSGTVPRTKEELLQLKGVGPKTANLVLGLAYRIPAICVDTHVHRISNRLGWVKTAHPEETERALMRVVPKTHWIELNTLLVSYGQRVCVPVSPFCSRCAVRRFCMRAGVVRSR